MSLPERLYDLNKDEDGYGYYYRDEKGERVTHSTYGHWYDGTYYHLIWENMADYCKAAPAIYGPQGVEGVYERVTDEELIDKIFKSFKYEVSRPLQTDGPVQYYENNSPFNSGSGVGPMNPNLFAMNMAQNAAKSSQMDYSDMKTDIKFCPNCGTKREGQLKFCTECGARLSK